MGIFLINPHNPMMHMESRNQYLKEVRREYFKANRRRKTLLLDEAEQRTGLERKYLIKKLKPTSNLDRTEPVKRSRPVVYGYGVRPALVRAWEIFDYASGARLAGALKNEVDRLRALGELRCPDDIAQKLKSMGPATIDRALAHEREVRRLGRYRTPSVRPLLHQKIPVKLPNEWNRSEVGCAQLDYVTHCGQSSAGDFVHTLSFAEIATGWWEGNAQMGRSQKATNISLSSIVSTVPFSVQEIHPDNDSGMINDLIFRFCQEEGIRMSRSRPLKKNDNCWVEQRNWTHIRKLVGYRRYDTQEELICLNNLYQSWARYKNFFLPSMKLMTKERIGGKIKRTYDSPKTPYQRVLELGALNAKEKARLAALYQSLNPAALKRSIENQQTLLYKLYERKQRGQVAGMMKKQTPRSVSSLMIQPMPVRCHG